MTTELPELKETLTHEDARQVVATYRACCVAEATFPGVFGGGAGVWAWTTDGKRCLDLIAGYGVMSTGWNHPRLVDRLRRQASRSLFAPPMLPTVESAALAECLLETLAMPEGWRCVRATGGADANEQAFKAIAAWARIQGKPTPHRVLRFSRAYHGGTSLMLELSDPGPLRRRASVESHHPMLPLPKRTSDINEVVKLLDRDPTIVAVFVEPVVGSGGVHPFPLGYLEQIRGVCTERRVSLVFDEVITGCGRVGAMLCAHLANIDPDAITLGKGLSAGAAAVGAALLSPELASALESQEDTSTTFAWSPLAAALAMENLLIIDEEHLPSRAALVGASLRTGLERGLQAHLPGAHAIRSVGMMIGIDLLDEPWGTPSPDLTRRLLIRCKQAGLWVGASWDWQSIVLLPPLVMTMEEAEEAVERFGLAAEAVATARRAKISPR